MKKKMTYAAIVGMSILVLFSLLAGCSNSAGPVTPAMNSSITDASLAALTAQSEISLLQAGGFGPDSGRGLFSVGWREIFNRRIDSTFVLGRALAVGFSSADSGTIRQPRGGVDIGDVFLNFGSNHLQLDKHVGPAGGVLYTSSEGRRFGCPTEGNIQFISGAEYQFQVTGSLQFSAFTAGVTAPTALISIQSPTDTQTISMSNDLTITWSGGTASGNILLTVMPAPPPPPRKLMGDGHDQGRGPGDMVSDDHGSNDGGEGGGENGGEGHFGDGHDGPIGPPLMFDSTRAIIVKLNTNPRTYTIPALQLQNLVGRTRAFALHITVGQMTVVDVPHDSSTVRLVLRNGDGVRVKVQ